MDEWLSVQGSAPQRDPEEKEATAVRLEELHLMK